MNKIVTLYKSYLPILVLVVYSIGYIFLVNYYLNFGVEIVFFLSLTDILFTALDLLVVFVTLVVLLEIVMFITSSVLFSLFSKEEKDVKNDPLIEDILKKADENYINSKDKFRLVSLLLTVIILFILISYADNSFFFGLTLFTLIPIKLHNLISGFEDQSVKENKDQNIEISKFRTGVIFFLIAVLIFGAYIYGNIAADKVKNKNSPFLEIDVEFIDNGKTYSTELDTTKLFIGQSSNYIFLYDLPTEKTSVFSKSNLESLKFKDPTSKIERQVKNKINNIKKTLHLNDSIREK